VWFPGERGGVKPDLVAIPEGKDTEPENHWENSEWVNFMIDIACCIRSTEAMPIVPGRSGEFGVMPWYRPLAGITFKLEPS
jgi:hypothetical protein